MLCAHIDTVAPSEDYSFDPYTPDYDKAAEAIGSREIVAGLGSNDDGASVVSLTAAFRYFIEVVVDQERTLTESPSADLLLVLTCEEERSGINGMTGLWNTLKNEVDYAIIGEPTCMKAATAERGLLVIDATAHGISGHAARNEGVNAIHIALEDITALKNHDFSRISPRIR
jgi:acetylornithine deacetylase